LVKAVPARKRGLQRCYQETFHHRLISAAAVITAAWRDYSAAMETAATEAEANLASR
jgi:hypothetical protein